MGKEDFHNVLQLFPDFAAIIAAETKKLQQKDDDGSFSHHSTGLRSTAWHSLANATKLFGRKHSSSVRAPEDHEESGGTSTARTNSPTPAKGNRVYPSAGSPSDN